MSKVMQGGGAIKAVRKLIGNKAAQEGLRARDQKDTRKRDHGRQKPDLSLRAFSAPKPKKAKARGMGPDQASYLVALRLARRPNADNKRVLSLLTEAAEAGSGEAAVAIASWYVHGKYVSKNLKRATEWFAMAARLGCADGYYGIAVAHHLGKGGMTKNLRMAFENYLCAALRGEANAIREVGRCYWHGYGVKRDHGLAEIWLQRADELGVDD